MENTQAELKLVEKITYHERKIFWQLFNFKNIRWQKMQFDIEAREGLKRRS